MKRMQATVQELEVWYILPAIRKAFAIEMIRQGIPQKRIAVLLGVTSAAISQYKNDKRAKSRYNKYKKGGHDRTREKRIS